MTNTCINNFFFVSVSFKSQLFRLRHALSTILSGITTSTVASRFFFLFLFYLNSTKCEILFSLSLSLSLSLLDSFPFVCVCMRPIQNNHTMMNPCNCRSDKRRRWCQQFFSLNFYSSISSCVLRYAYLCVIDRSLDFVSSRTSRSLAVSKQTYLNNKSSIILYWSDCEIEGKELYRWMM
jgi:hypothetical protein